MLLFAFAFALLGAFGVYVGLDGLNLMIGRFHQYGVTHYGWGLAVNGFALAAFFLFLWRERARVKPTAVEQSSDEVAELRARIAALEDELARVRADREIWRVMAERRAA